jgi:2-dehydropantoate 2-reductase
MRIAVFGSGGVGGYFGGRLAQAGEDVVFIARGAHLEAMREDGLRVDSIKGDFVAKPVNATDDPAKAGPVDVILVGVKAGQVEEAAHAMRPMVGENTFVVPLQNGVEAPTRLARVLGREHVLGGLCAVMTYVAGPGHICHAGLEPVIQFGELDNRMSPRVEALQRAFANAQGLTAKVPADIEAAMWQKFLFIAGWGAVGAVTRAPAGVLRERAETRELISQAVKEIYEVARARNVSLGPEIIDTTMQTVDALPDAGTASMQRDIMGGRPSELDTQTGAVVRLGREAGVETPLNSFFYAALLPLELRARGEVRFEA